MLDIKKLQKIATLLLVMLLAINCGVGKDLEGIQEKDKQDNEPQKQPKTKQEQLAELVKEEKFLEETAKSVLQQLQQEKAPTQPFFEKIFKNLNADIKKAKKELEEAKKTVKNSEEILISLKILEEKLNQYGEAIEVNTLHPTIQTMYNAVLDTPEIDQAMKEARPINTNKLSTNKKEWYQRITTKYAHFDLKNNVGVFITYALLEDTQKLSQVINTQLALFQNIQKQHELRKEIS